MDPAQAHDRSPRKKSHTRKLVQSGGAKSRRLSFEPLEERRLLATITVNTLIDVNNGSDGLTTLREAIAAAMPNDTIDFAVTGTINLMSIGSGHLTVNKSLTIQGPGADLLTIKAYDPDVDGTKDSDGFRAFHVSDGNSGNLINVTISALTVTGGDPELDPGAEAQEHTFGGAIRSHENLTVVDCVVTDSFTVNGGGIGNGPQVGSSGPFNGTLTVIDSLISGSSANDGGGLFTQRGNMEVIRTTVEDNFASNAGGGIFNLNGDVTITDSTISGNESLNPEKDFSGKGGGVASFYGDLTVNGSTISGNHAAYLGGGIFFNNTGNLTVANSTISGNSADEKGGGIYIFYYVSGAVTIAHSTITGNLVGTSSGGIGSGTEDVDVELDHTIVAGNIRGSSTRDDLDGSFDASFTLIGDKRSASVNNVVGSLIGTTSSPIDAILGTLADNGGPTFTHTLLTGSPAIDAGDPGALAGMGDVPLYDQRGNPHSRVLGGRIDIGAVEIEPPTGPALPGDYNLDGVVDAADYIIWRKTLGSSVPQYSGADGNGDTTVDAQDYSVWTGNFGDTLPPGSGGGASSEAASQESTSSVETMNGDWIDTTPTARAHLKNSPRAHQSTIASASHADLLLALELNGGDGFIADEGDCESQSGVQDRDATLDELFAEYGNDAAVTWRGL
ncbi:MAG: choice-of-anchor Q domain-containing protein [Pirellulales bacterium]